MPLNLKFCTDMRWVLMIERRQYDAHPHCIAATAETGAFQASFGQRELCGVQKRKFGHWWGMHSKQRVERSADEMFRGCRQSARLCFVDNRSHLIAAWWRMTRLWSLIWLCMLLGTSLMNPKGELNVSWLYILKISTFLHFEFVRFSCLPYLRSSNYSIDVRSITFLALWR